MKSASSIQLSKAWWKKEAPEGLGKVGEAFGAAIEAYAKANAALRKPTRKALQVFEDALDDVEDAGKDVAAEAKALEKAEKSGGDKARLKDLKNTITVMGRPLDRELNAARASAEEVEQYLDDIEDDGGDDPLTDPKRHAAYISALSPKLKKGTFSFALAMTSNDPADMRFLFHRKRGGRSLAGRLRRALKVKKFTFGVAGTQKLAEEVAGEDVSKRTLVLFIEGRRIPSLARRVKVMLRRLGVTQFSRVKVYENGKEIESADETTDEKLEELDLSVPDEDDSFAGITAGAGAGKPPPSRGAAGRAPTTASSAAAALRNRLAKLNALVAHLPRAKTKTFREVADLARKRIDQGALGPAERAISALEQRFGGTARRAKSAPGGGDGGAGRLSKLRVQLRDLALEAKPALDAAPEHRGQMRAGIERARALINAHAPDEAQEELFALRALLASIRETAV